jgi:hypothetical protein
VGGSTGKKVREKYGGNCTGKMYRKKVWEKKYGEKKVKEKRYREKSKGKSHMTTGDVTSVQACGRYHFWLLLSNRSSSNVTLSVTIYY